ncbi:phenylalanyl-tRNA ligase subunit beta [Mycobacterium tuberculosis CAS/NITR204]|uniref:Phenylalanyl-tRNA ligase subunit beta n=1 Tax=Mycobacterium tuberculosis CAS/NITR204 TaxID=1310114 RepID=R4MI43_MYCTX|nr:phenylalanyl-tRNA ligase subunit beta [Mycobacterium tuberculosis CAS/NITR204]
MFDLWGLEADDSRRMTTRVLNPLEADRPQLATTLLPALLEPGAQRDPRAGRRRAVRHRPGGPADRADARCRVDPG